MSAYGKGPQQSEYDTRSTQHPQSTSQPQHNYSHSQSGYGSYGQYDAPAPADRHRQSLAYESAGGSQLAEPSGSYSLGFNDPEPRVLRYSPAHGLEGSHFTVFLHSPTDLSRETDPRRFKLCFGSLRCPATITKSETEEDVYQLMGMVPPSRNTGWVEERINVYVNIEDQDGNENGTLEVGEFNYSDASPRLSYGRVSPSHNSGKRKRSLEPDNSAKRVAGQIIRPKSEDFGTYGYAAPSQYPPYVSSTGSDRSYGIYSSYTQPEHHQSSSYQQRQSPRHFPYTYAGSADPTGLQSTAQTWGHPSALSVRSPVGPEITSPGTRPGSPPTPLDSQNVPKLIRTSTLQQEAQASNQSPTSAGAGTTFNPYSIYPHKAVLNLEGDLQSMTRNWAQEEWNSRRRLVQFWRRQDRNTIHASFRAVLPEHRRSDSICISCIWWEQQKSCYVTSVDCISLLESLIAVRFTVEEKNRIRRNLEGFRPLTVSKAKPDSENFFKLIMAFPSPKPRNIEKDVKVFPWSILSQALGKIVGKYSASYASTASVIPQGPSSTPYPGAPSGESSATGHSENPSRAASSPSVGDSTTPTAGAPANILTGPIIPKPGSSVTSSPMGPSVGSTTTDLSLPMNIPSVGNLWQQHPPTLPAIPGQQSMTPPGPRSSSWSFPDAPGSASSSTGNSHLYYQRLTEGRESTSGVESQHIPASVP